MPKYIFYADSAFTITASPLSINRSDTGYPPGFYILAEDGDFGCDFPYAETNSPLDDDIFFLQHKPTEIPGFVGLEIGSASNTKGLAVAGSINFHTHVTVSRNKLLGLYGTRLRLSRHLLHNEDIFKEYLATGFSPETLGSVSPEFLEKLEKTFKQMGIDRTDIKYLGSLREEAFKFPGFETATLGYLMPEPGIAHYIPKSDYTYKEHIAGSHTLFKTFSGGTQFFFYLTPSAFEKFESHQEKKDERRMEVRVASGKVQEAIRHLSYKMDLWPGGLTGFLVYLGIKGLREFVTAVEIDLLDSFFIKFEMPDFVPDTPAYFGGAHTPPEKPTREEQAQLLAAIPKQKHNSLATTIASLYCRKSGLGAALVPHRKEIAECNEILKQRIKEALDGFKLPDKVTGTSGVHEQISPEVVRKKRTRK